MKNLMQVSLLIPFSLMMIESRSHKEKPKTVVDDDEVDKKKDDKKDDDDNDDDNADHDDHAFPPLYLKIEASQNLLPSKPRLFQEALLRVADELTVAKTNELIKVAVLRIVNEAAKKDGEILKTNVPKIVEVVRVTTKQQHRLDYMKQIIMMRENDKLDSSSEANFKYQNKNDIEDIKEEKRVMSLVEIVKFCDDILERVLKEVKLKIFETEFQKKVPLLGELDLDVMKVYER
ncbi:hypothetical protein Tco_0610978 [Tanacetum coccineum]